MLTTKIYWMLHNHCTANCWYCPTHFKNGSIPRSINDYLKICNLLIDHYRSLDRIIVWSFDGGEPLEIELFPKLLRLCKENNGSITLTTNGGKEWLDWWAISPYIDSLNLTYHYWQNQRLIEFIIQSFLKNNKPINVIVPIRHEFFDWDIDRANQLEIKYNISVNKNQLYKDNSQIRGMYDYTDDQLHLLKGDPLVEEKKNFQETTFQERAIEIVNISPSFTGQLCNTGIERLYISHDGWVSGSICGNSRFGNIWENNLELPLQPSICNKIVCTDNDDKQITKFL